MKWLATLPSTNFRIFVTMMVVVGTAVDYWISGDVSGEWLIFLGSMAGIDVAAFGIKRKTYEASKDPPPAASAPPDREDAKAGDAHTPRAIAPLVATAAPQDHLHEEGD
jgi:hypothetical protein